MIQGKLAVKLVLMVLMVLLYSSLVYAQGPGQTRKDKALTIAAGKGDLAKVKALLEQGANINGSSGASAGSNPLWTAVTEGRVNVVQYLLEKGALQIPNMLFDAAASGDVGIVKILIRHGADVNYTDKWGHNAVFWATKNLIKDPKDERNRDRNRRYEEVIQVLKAAGAR